MNSKILIWQAQKDGFISTLLTTFIACLFCNPVYADYAPSYINRKYSSAGVRTGIYARYWMNGLKECFGEATNVLSYLVPTTIVDNQGYLYLAVEYSFWSQGFVLRLQKRDLSDRNACEKLCYPWYEIFDDISYVERAYPKLVLENSNYLDEFKNHVHNVFQQSFAQEMEGTTSDYIYLLSYMPPARYCNDYANALNKPEREGLFILKIKKENLEIVDKKLYNANDYPSLSYDRTPRITNTWNYTRFNQEEGNYHGFIDGDDIYVFYLAHGSNDSDLLRTYYLKINANNLELAKTICITFVTMKHSNPVEHSSFPDFKK